MKEGLNSSNSLRYDEFNNGGYLLFRLTEAAIKLL